VRVGTRQRREDLGTGAGSGGRPVLLATFGTPFDEEAAAFAVDSAVEAGEPLIVANITALEPLRLSVILGYDALEEFTPEVSDSGRRLAELARSLGVRVERRCGCGPLDRWKPSYAWWPNGGPGCSCSARTGDGSRLVATAGSWGGSGRGRPVSSGFRRDSHRVRPEAPVAGARARKVTSASS
jgi:hypothetical protein